MILLTTLIINSVFDLNGIDIKYEDSNDFGLRLLTVNSEIARSTHLICEWLKVVKRELASSLN